MPRMPKWVGDAFENLLSSMFLHAEVIETEDIGPQLKWVRLQGDFSKANHHIGYAVAFRVNDTAFRNYTPTYFDSSKGICDILFHLHGNGPGSTFANNLINGDQLYMVPPRGKKIYQPSLPHHFYFGDETSIGLCRALQRNAWAQQQHCDGILELDKNTPELVEKLDLQPGIVAKKTPEKQSQLLALLDEKRAALGSNWTSTAFYLTGNATSIQFFKNALRERGVANRNITTQAYWAAGKTGL